MSPFRIFQSNHDLKNELLNQSDDRKLLLKPRAGLFHLLVLLITFVLTISTWQLSKHQLRQSVKQSFEQEMTSLMHFFSDQVLEIEILLRGSAAAININGDVLNRAIWADYVQQLELERLFPAATGLGFAYEVHKDELNAFLRMQKINDPNFSIQHITDKDTIYPVTNISPRSINLPWTVGFDMAGDETIHDSIIRAKKSGQATITEFLQLQIDDPETLGFLLFVPVYSESKASQSHSERNLLGLVYAPVKFSHLIQRTQELGGKLIEFNLLNDPGRAIGAVYDHGNVKPKYSDTDVLSLYDKNWAIEFQSTPALDRQLFSSFPSYILGMGLSLQLIYVTAVLLLWKNRNTALKFANDLHDEFADKTQKNLTAEQRYNLAIKGSSVGLWDWDIEKGNIFWSTPLFEMIGEAFIPEGIGLSYFTKRLHADDLDRVMNQVTEHFENISPLYNTEYRLRHAQGHYIWVHASGHAMWSEDGVPLRMSGSATNVTERKLAVEQLIAVNGELKKFAHLASHDLKTPLRAINNLSQCIEEDQADVLDEENITRLQIIRDRVSLSLRLLQDILTYSESGNVSQKIESVNLSKMMSIIIKSFKLSSHQKIICEGVFPQVMTVAAQLRQVLSNLISNAISHHDKEEQLVTISCNVCNGDIVFSVTDNGPGIPDLYHEKIFTPFITMKTKEQGGGTGLGLSMVKSLVEGMKGKVWIEHNGGSRGTTVCFTWPATLMVKKDSEHNERQ